MNKTESLSAGRRPVLGPAQSSEVVPKWSLPIFQIEEGNSCKEAKVCKVSSSLSSVSPLSAEAVERQLDSLPVFVLQVIKYQP